ncbi:MAG: hypothetical protein ABSC24_13080, partial [Verrucomicrobiota bacterium]
GGYHFRICRRRCAGDGEIAGAPASCRRFDFLFWKTRRLEAGAPGVSESLQPFLRLAIPIS